MFKYFARKLALRKPVPKIIPMSLPRCADNDSYAVYIEIPDLDMRFLCKSEVKQGVEGVLWVNEKNGADACVLRSTLNSYKWTLKIEHYYKGWVLEYQSAFIFCFQNIFQKHRFVYSKDRLAQAIFNNKKLVRSDRIRVLEYILEKTANNSDYQTNSLNLGTELYSKRWFFHPDRDALKNHYKLICNSLFESGDLIKNDYSYKLSAKALITISEYERDEQKHFDSQDSARKTRNLTKAIIFLGLLNFGFHVFRWVYEVKLLP